MSTLTSVLKYGFAGNSERSRMLSSEAFKKSLEGVTCRFPEDKGEDKYKQHDAYKALLQSERNAITNSTLVQEQVWRTAIEGAEPFRCMRDVVPTIQVGSYSTRFVKGETGTYANEVAEGAKIEIDTQEYSKLDIAITKYGVRPLITNELIEDGLFPVIELEIKKAGARLENKLNRVILNALINGTTANATPIANTVNPAGPHIAVADIARAIGEVKKDNYLPDILVTHPTAEAWLFQDSNIAYASYMGSAGPITSGNFPRILGLSPYTCTATDGASPVWDDTTAASDITAFIISKNDCGVLTMRRDLTVEQYDDPIHDLVGIAFTMRYGADVLQANAGCLIYHK
jgi:HK97 family phage major capsid protein